MKTRKLLFIPLLLTGLAFSTSGCSKDDKTPSNNNNQNNNNNQTIRVTSVSVTPKEITIKVYETYELSYVVYPNNATNKEISWVVDNGGEGIVVVERGYVTGLSVGQTYVRAISVDNVYANDACFVNVVPIDNGNPVDPGEPTDPSNPSDPGNPSDPTDPSNPADPGTDNPGNEPTVTPVVTPTGDDDTDSENQEIDANPVPVEIPEPIPHETVTEEIGTLGGTINDTDNNLSINIPQGALDSTTSISATYVDEPSLIGDNPAMNFMGAVDFGPSGTVFDEPVEVTIKLAKTTYHNKLSVFCYDEVNDLWDYVTNASVSGGNATFSVNHFSRYKCLDITDDMLNKFVELVHTAQDSGYDDAWIIGNYEDYLINDKHVMDEYAIYDGLYYEACGLFISGRYSLENGKQGDPDVLSKQIGESNKVGNTYGLSTVGGLTTSRAESDKAKESTTENQEIIDVTVDIDYTMIKPNIDLTAEKVILDKNESTTVSVYTHYTNPNNKTHPELVLPNYPLTLPYNLKHFSVDAKELTTNGSGQATFTATALNEGTENVKVMFYVAGYFGQYSASYIKLKCGGDFTISGHISQTISGTFKGGPEYETGGMTCTQIGSYNLKVEYDVEGAIDVNEDGTYKGLLQFTNPSVTFGGTDAIHYYSDGDSFAELYFTMYDEEVITAPTMKAISFTANVSEDKTCILSTSTIVPIVDTWIDGNVHEIVSYNGHSMDLDTPMIAITEFKNISSLLLPFTLEAGTYTDSSSSLITTYKFGARTGLGDDDWEFADGIYYQILSTNYSTEQRITVIDNREQTNP